MAKKRRRKKYKIHWARLIMSIVLVIIIITMGVTLNSIRNLKMEQRRLRAQNIELQAQKEALEEEYKNVNDLNYIEEQARIQLNMVKRGETLYILRNKKAEQDKKAAENSSDKS